MLQYGYHLIVLKFLPNSTNWFVCVRSCFLPIHSPYRSQNKILKSKVEDNTLLLDILQWCSIAEGLDKPVGWDFATILLEYCNWAMCGMGGIAMNKTESLSNKKGTLSCWRPRGQKTNINWELSTQLCAKHCTLIILVNPHHKIPR